MSSNSLMISIVEQRCPSCRKGKMFVGNPYNLKTFNKMHHKCSNCGSSFELEPGFYMGAMYVSYAIQIVIFALVFISTKILYPEASIIWYASSIIGTVLLLFPLTFRLSRAIWLHIFVPFNARNEENLKSV